MLYQEHKLGHAWESKDLGIGFPRSILEWYNIVLPFPFWSHGPLYMQEWESAGVVSLIHISRVENESPD